MMPNCQINYFVGTSHDGGSSGATATSNLLLFPPLLTKSTRNTKIWKILL